MHRHDRIRDWLAGWIAEHSGQTVATEQYVPRWDRRKQDGTLERARLDVVFQDHNGQTVYVDVSVPAASTTCPATARTRMARDGAAAARMEDSKRLRYPGPTLVPFVVEALGRPGSDAVALLRSFAPTDPEERSKVLGCAWQSLSVLLQTENAELLMSAYR